MSGVSATPATAEVHPADEDDRTVQGSIAMGAFEREEETVAFSGEWLDQLARATRPEAPEGAITLEASGRGPTAGPADPPPSTEISDAILALSAEPPRADGTLPLKPVFVLPPPPIDLTDDAELLSEASIVREVPERISHALLESVHRPLARGKDPFLDVGPRPLDAIAPGSPPTTPAPEVEPRTTTLLMLAGAIGFLTKAALAWSIIATILMLTR